MLICVRVWAHVFSELLTHAFLNMVTFMNFHHYVLWLAWRDMTGLRLEARACVVPRRARRTSLWCSSFGRCTASWRLHSSEHHCTVAPFLYGPWVSSTHFSLSYWPNTSSAIMRTATRLPFVALDPVPSDCSILQPSHAVHQRINLLIHSWWACRLWAWLCAHSY